MHGVSGLLRVSFLFADFCSCLPNHPPPLPTPSQQEGEQMLVNMSSPPPPKAHTRHLHVALKLQRHLRHQSPAPHINKQLFMPRLVKCSNLKGNTADDLTDPNPSFKRIESEKLYFQCQRLNIWCAASLFSVQKVKFPEKLLQNRFVLI